VVGATSTAGLGWSTHPQAQGGGPTTPKRPKKKRGVLDFWGWPDHPQGLGGGFGHPLRPVWGGRSHPRPLTTPKSPKPIFCFFFFFFFFWPFGVAGPPPWAWGSFDHPRMAVGVAPAAPWPKMGWPGRSRFSSLFFFFFFFSFSFFLKK
jgi:hypothetical protein